MLRAEVLETILYGCVTWSPRACHYYTLRQAHHSFLTRCIGRRENNFTDLSISFLDTLMKPGSESVDAIMLGRRIILFAAFVADGGSGTAELRDVRRADGGSGLRGGAGKRVDGVSPG